MVRHPLAGNILAFFQYVLGFKLLGHDVLYVETSSWPDSCYDPQTRSYSSDPSAGLAIVADLFATHGITRGPCYIDRDSGTTYGTSRDEIIADFDRADLFLDIGGTSDVSVFARCRRRALVDMDPVFTQLGRFAFDRLREYDSYFTYGTNLGRPGCSVPTYGVPWRSTVPPVVLGIWDSREGLVLPPEESPMTTIATWDAYGTIEHAGGVYGQKDIEFMRVLGLPRRTSQRLEIALAGADASVRDQFRRAGWSLADPASVSASVSAYRAYIQRSKAEFSVAKHAYVAARSGWFSDRSACYLASGRPVVVQDTGFRETYGPQGGVFTFSSEDEAVRMIAQVNAAYDQHASAARDTAAQLFDYSVVLPALLQLASE